MCRKKKVNSTWQQSDSSALFHIPGLLETLIYIGYTYVMNEENLTEKELLEMPKEDLVGMILGMQSGFNEMKRTIDLLSEKVNIMNQRSYGRKSEAARS